MNIQRQCAMIKSVDKSIKDKERKLSKQNKIIDDMYRILRKVNKCLDEVSKSDLDQKEYKAMLEFFKIRGLNEYEIVKYYPNFK